MWFTVGVLREWRLPADHIQRRTGCLVYLWTHQHHRRVSVVKQFTLTYKQRGSNALLSAKVFSNSLLGAEKALLELEDMDGNNIVIIRGEETRE